MSDALRRLRRRPRLTRTVLAVTAGMVLVSGAPQWRDSGSTHAEAAAALIDLKSAADLRDQFNRDQGNPRLILLLSPT